MCAPAGASSEPSAKPLLVSAIALYMSLLLITLVTVAAAIVVAEEAAATAWVEIAASVLFAVVVLIWASVEARRLDLGVTRAVGRGWLLLAVPLAVGTYALARTCMWGISTIGVPELEPGADLLASGWGSVSLVLLFCVQPAIFEELAFRGVILAALAHVMKSREAVVVSALMFMTLHLMVFSFPHLLVMGVLYGWLRVRSGSLYPSMLAHFFHNLIWVLAFTWFDGGAA